MTTSNALEGGEISSRKDEFPSRSVMIVCERVSYRRACASVDQPVPIVSLEAARGSISDADVPVGGIYV